DLLTRNPQLLLGSGQSVSQPSRGCVGSSQVLGHSLQLTLELCHCAGVLQQVTCSLVDRAVDLAEVGIRATDSSIELVELVGEVDEVVDGTSRLNDDTNLPYFVSHESSGWVCGSTTQYSRPF